MKINPDRYKVGDILIKINKDVPYRYVITHVAIHTTPSIEHNVDVGGYLLRTFTIKAYKGNSAVGSLKIGAWTLMKYYTYCPEYICNKITGGGQ